MRELQLLQHIYAANPHLPQSVTIPPGDDMAAINFMGRTLLIGVDQVADGVHFNLNNTPIDRVGAKAVKRSLSDVAAMAAVPHTMVVSAVLPKNLQPGHETRLTDAIIQTARRYNCPVIGGDITTWDHPLSIAVTVTAAAPDHPPITRRGAQIGDALFVTGQLGGSTHTTDARTHHLDFEPRITLAQQLARLPGNPLRCMIDLSDGLASDAARLCEHAADPNTAVQLKATQLPISPAAHQLAQNDSTPPWQHALADGEDYELCFAVPAERAPDVPDCIDGVPITPVGRFVARHEGDPRVTIQRSDGTHASADGMGWEHRS